jgi:hypothetical protein
LSGQVQIIGGWPGLAALAALAACATPAPSSLESYGPLSVNLVRGADFYVTQHGAFAPAAVENGVIVVHLRNEPFQIGTNAPQMNICLNQNWAPEIQADPQGYKASCLSGAKAGARQANSDALLVYSGKKWSDGSSTLMEGTNLKAKPLQGYLYGYQVDDLSFVEQPEVNLKNVRGTLHGYVVVYKQHERRNRNIMPIQLVFAH